MRGQGYIERRREVLVGKPVIRGARIGVERPAERLSQSASKQDLIEACPDDLTWQHVGAGLVSLAR